jgi:hypothetical protein
LRAFLKVGGQDRPQGGASGDRAQAVCWTVKAPSLESLFRGEETIQAG